MREAAGGARCGISLSELLVVAAMLVLLLGLAVPLFRGMRVRHDDLQNLTNLGASAKDFAIYAADHDGRSVNAGLPEQAAGNPWYEEMGPGIDPIWQYRNHHSGWPAALYYSGYAPAQHWQATIAPGGTESWEDLEGFTPFVRYVQPGTLYRYPDPMWTEAFIWTNPGSGQMTVAEYSSFYKRVRLDEVDAPARKGLLVYEESLNDDQTLVSVAFVDGHAKRHRWFEGAPTGVRPLSNSQTPGKPVYATLHGHEGIDF
ncbi:MAG: pilus assembly FimT family protein [Phycisphaerales bacterium]